MNKKRIKKEICKNTMDKVIDMVFEYELKNATAPKYAEKLLNEQLGVI